MGDSLSSIVCSEPWPESSVPAGEALVLYFSLRSFVKF